VLLITRDKLKLRKKVRAGMDSTLSKVEMASGVPVTLDPFDETKIEIQARCAHGPSPLGISLIARHQLPLPWY
jgi:hypothetical protein